MKLHNSNIREILERSAQNATPLTRAEIDTQYQLFLKKTEPHSTLVESSSYYSYKELISHITMFTTKQIAATALTLIIGAGTLTVGYDRTLAYNLALDIKNAPNASEYNLIGMDFKDILLNGEVVNKEHISEVLEKHRDNISIVGGITGVKGPDTITGEDANIYYTEEEIIEPDKFVEDTYSLEEEAQMLGISPEEIERMDADITKYPYGIGFEEAVTFLELTKEKGMTYIGVDKDGKIIFFTIVTI